MPTYLCLSVTFLDPFPSFHGRGDADEPEWPPSPLRAFQAVVAAAANCCPNGEFQANVRPMFEWLQRHDAPIIVAPAGHVGAAVRIAVPNNDMDVVAIAWAKRQEPKKQPNELKTMKTVRPTRLVMENGNSPTVHYLWPLVDGECDKHKEVLFAAARSVTHLGWGIDMVAANASIIADADTGMLPGEYWRPTNDGAAPGYRVPTEGTIDALITRHEAFLNRIGPDGFNPVPPLSVFRIVGYRRASEPSPRQFAAFGILNPDAGGARSFDATRRTRDVAGMVRHAVADAARQHGWSEEQINVFVHGKTPDGQRPASGEKSPDRFLYLPLPTINHRLRRVESIRRILIAAPTHCREQIAWVRRALAGAELRNEASKTTALLSILPGDDWVLRQYVGQTRTWSTVTPVLFPGHDDRDPAKAGRLLRIAFAQAGYKQELMNQTELEWRRVGFHAGLDLASRYLPPENLNHFPQYHVRVRFPTAIQGPLVVGSGRFRGFGLFAAIDDR